MEAYKRWVRTNRDFVRQLGSLINGLTWLLPDEFGYSEIGPEAVSSLLGMMTTINEHIIDTTPTRMHTPPPEPSFLPLSLCLTLLKDLETLVEVAAEQLCGEEKKWNFIAITEAVKVLVRLIVFRNSGYKMLLLGGETENTENSSDVPRPEERNGNLQMHIPKNVRGLNSYNLEGRALSALNSLGEHARMVSEPTWLRRVQHQQTIIEPPTMVMKPPSLSTFLSEKGFPGSLFVTGEAMFVLRPLIYVLLVRKYGARSWFPWVISLAVDVIGNGILSCINLCPQRSKRPQFQLSYSEKDELKRRKLLWALYLMRDPFFSTYTRRRLESTQKLVEPIPIVGFFTEKLVELIIGSQTRYTYFSGA
nr:peroxisome biogenesis protein 16 isoform X1 [Ipomoea batatas]